MAVYDNSGGSGAITWKEQDLYGSSRLGMWQPNVSDIVNNTTGSLSAWNTWGSRQYELSNHLGNVLATITDRRVQVADNSTTFHLEADVSSAQTYYAFGGLMPGMQYTPTGGTAYKYGFNGKENDNDVKGVGNQYDYGFRIYDTRIGKFLSVDPLSPKYPELTLYQFASNKPINFIDIDGAEALEIVHWIANTGTSRQMAKLSAPTLKAAFGYNENQTLMAFGVVNGLVSSIDAKGMADQYEKYQYEALKQMFSMRYDTFMQEDLSFNKKKLVPGFRMAEDTYNGLRTTINMAYAGDPYAMGQVFGLCLTVGIGGAENMMDFSALEHITGGLIRQLQPFLNIS